ncbi:Type III restriction enzyme, res subunit/ATPase family associated with various cellular activities (AAA), putative [Angomonas deanei]|uniref:Type III restriction enzyme, res subunit/ATPase family associated with various cellular activities (AAA), putative n=1 Tax=Angomonas deanei TaxID=59799 RepID=A0A7G2C6F2_9TRYP|nr:Type III restriction enzyme, res subunit/ATPase family associated with various cellular activities (AAA), putative [Angomonas deanei]
MSSGFTDSLVLTLPVYWWPSFTTLQEYPVTAERTLAAAIARFPASLGAPAVELSRLGVTVFHLAEWNEDTTHVLVYDPFTGETVALPVSLADSKGVLQGKGRPSLPQLARQGRIRVQPMPLDMEDRKKRKTNTNDRTTRQILSDCLFDNYYKVLLGHIQLATRQSVPLGSIIVTGNPSHTKCMVRHVTENAPTLFSVPSQDSGAWVTFVVEHRVLDLSLLFRMDEREALAAVRATLRLPPIPPSQQSTARHCLLVEMHGIDRLDTTAVTHTAVIISEILAGCHRIEKKQHNPHCCVFFLSTAQYVQEVHPTLCSRLGKSLLALTPPTVEECKQCLEKLLSPDELDALTQTPERWRWIALRMSTTLRIEELLELNPTTLRTWMTEALDRYASAQEMHSAAAQDTHYGHLYGVGPCIASLERLLVWPLAHLTELQELGIPTTKGALLCGPTGCGKTVVMTALARRLRELQVNFTLNVIIVDGLSLIEKEVGKTEKNISQLFQKARSRTPTVLFIDNLDALAPPRGQLTSETNLVADRSLSTLLTERMV